MTKIRTAIMVVGCVLLVAGAWRGTSTAMFVKRALRVSGKVVAVEELKGPPKPRQKTPLHISFSMPDGSEHRAITNLPLMQVVRAGDVITVLVDQDDPQKVRLPLWSELWAAPLTYIVGGLLLIILSRVMGVRGMR